MTAAAPPFPSHHHRSSRLTIKATLIDVEQQIYTYCHLKRNVAQNTIRCCQTMQIASFVMTIFCFIGFLYAYSFSRRSLYEFIINPIAITGIIGTGIFSVKKLSAKKEGAENILQRIEEIRRQDHLYDSDVQSIGHIIIRNADRVNEYTKMYNSISHHHLSLDKDIIVKDRIKEGNHTVLEVTYTC